MVSYHFMKKDLEQILKVVIDKSLEGIAINVAHYHHERWDGLGYPNGLKVMIYL